MFRSLQPTPREPIPKPMRKGTRSCAECRRRKIRCIFPTAEHEACKHCVSRGIHCVEQKRDSPRTGKPRSQPDLQERVARLESLLRSSLLHEKHGVDHDDNVLSTEARNQQADPTASTEKCGGTPSTGSLLETESSPASLDSISDNADPILSLFDNGIRSGMDNASHGENVSETIPGSASHKAILKRNRSRMALLEDLPTAELLTEVLNATGSWWQTWRPAGASVSYNRAESLQAFVSRTVGSDNPPVIALALLCIAVSIQQLDPARNYRIIQQLKNPPGELFQKYFDRVLRIIVNDSDYAVSLEGIEVAMMSSKLMMNLGIIRSCWMLCRKAITCAQLLGMHRSHRPLLVADTLCAAKSGQRIWTSLCHQDAYLSLILGLPYGFYDKAIPRNIQTQDPDTRLQHDLLKLSIRAIDRSQMGLSLSSEMAEDIQKDLNSLATTMPREFWNPCRDLATGAQGEETYLGALATQFWYHQIRVSVHMPLMIQSIQNHQLESHRAACLEASRDLLRVYHTMRSDQNSAFRMISIIDYQAFIASALLILGMLGYGSSRPIREFEDQSVDKKLVNLTLEMLRQSAEATSTASTASQAFQGLETLALLSSRDGCTYVERPHGKAKPFVKVIVPYSGTITVTPGDLLDHQDCAPNVPEEHPHPTFTFLDYEQMQLPSKDLSAVVENAGSSQSIDFAGDGQFEYPPVDFDWNTIMNTSIDESWAWLHDLNTTM